MDVDQRTERRLSKALTNRLGGAPPVERIERQGRRRQRRTRAFGGAAVVLVIVLGAGVTLALAPDDRDAVTAGEPTDAQAQDDGAEQQPGLRSPGAIKDEVLDALVATAPDMLTVIGREDDTTDRGQDPELGGGIEWDFTDPSLYDLERPPEGVDEWVRGDPGGGVRSTASVQVTPGFPSDGVDRIPVPATDAPCASCDFTGYHEVANSYVQWFVMKDDVQISLVSERPEVWPQMRSWLDRFAIRMDEIDTRSRPAASNTEFPTGYVSVLDLDSESTATEIDARVLADILGRGMISFDPALGQVTATIACHILTADYTTTSEQLLITDDTIEEAATCEPPAEARAADLEATASAVFDVLRSDPQWTRTQGTRLTLTGTQASLSGTIGTP